MDLKFSLGEEKTIVSSKIAVYPRVEGNILSFILLMFDNSLLWLWVDKFYEMLG